MLSSDYTSKDIERFWEKVNISDDPDVCWELKKGNGYGHFYMPNPRRYIRSHRVAYVLANGELPDHLLVCHHCDNKKCVNPKHLYAGTHSDNAKDFNNRHREYVPVYKSNANNAVKHNEGESNPKAKLTWENVREIRRLAKEGMRPKQLAELFDVSSSRIGMIINNKAWIE